jgi:hypothetical protein
VVITHPFTEGATSFEIDPVLTSLDNGAFLARLSAEKQAGRSYQTGFTGSFFYLLQGEILMRASRLLNVDEII